MLLNSEFMKAATTRKGSNMSEIVQFWLDNKMSTGIKVAEIGDQLLVLYRDKYYQVEKGVARMIGKKPLRYSKSSLPTNWKKALSGEIVPVEEEIPFAGDLAFATVNNAERVKRNKPRPPPPARTELEQPEPAQPPAQLTPTSGPKPIRKANKPAKMSAVPTMIIAKCPYCSNEHELLPEKAKPGKSFFIECDRCKTEFAVRIVPVMIYQAQVAAFR